jgi:subfamily B ATP-binding cassette protein MsbA
MASPVIPSNQKVMRRLLGFIKPYSNLLIWVLLGNLVFAGVDAYSTYLFKPLLDRGFIDHDTRFLATLPFVIIGLFILRGAGSFLASYCMGLVSRKLVLAFRLAIFEHYLKLPARFFDRKNSGQLLSLLTYDVEQMTNASGNSMTVLARESFFIVGVLIVLFYTNWQLSSLIFLVLPPIVIIIRTISKRFRRLSTNIQEGMGDVNHIANESIQGYKQIRIYHGEEVQKHQFLKVAKYNFQQEMKVIVTESLGAPIVQLLGSFVLALFFAVVFSGDMPLLSAGEFATLLAGMMAILKPIKNLTQVNAQIQKGLAACTSLFDLLDQPIEQSKATQKLLRMTGKISFEHVSFSYVDQDGPVLSDIHLDILPGQTVAFVGKSGSGKSTLMMLLSRFYDPLKGRILFDGQDITQYSLESVREQLALVSQEVMLFNDSIYHNIAYGATGDVSESSVIAAAKAAHVWEFAQELPEGLQTSVGEKGLNLSGGQRQRVAIARALIKDAPILILDEATSALDNESERIVQEALEGLKHGRTTLVIAHRLSTVQTADLIVVMDQGSIIEMGTHEELLQKGQYYALLHRGKNLC